MNWLWSSPKVRREPRSCTCGDDDSSLARYTDLPIIDLTENHSTPSPRQSLFIAWRSLVGSCMCVD